MLFFKVGILSCSFTPHIHLTILISARWSATSISFLANQVTVSLSCNILLRTQLLYNLPLTFNDVTLLVLCIYEQINKLIDWLIQESHYLHVSCRACPISRSSFTARRPWFLRQSRFVAISWHRPWNAPTTSHNSLISFAAVRISKIPPTSVDSTTYSGPKSQIVLLGFLLKILPSARGIFLLTLKHYHAAHWFVSLMHLVGILFV